MKIAPKIAAVTGSVLLLFLLGTDPQQLPSVLLTAPFVLLFIVTASLASFALGSLQISRQKKTKLVVVVATVPVLLLVLQSLGQLTVRDVLAVTVLFGVAYFYISRFSVSSTDQGVT